MLVQDVVDIALFAACIWICRPYSHKEAMAALEVISSLRRIIAPANLHHVWRITALHDVQVLASDPGFWGWAL
jgi:hypothetical protein